MTGLNITVMEDRIMFAGTNGVKLAEFGLDINADVKNGSYILGYAFASILRNVLDDDAQVFMRFEGRHAYIRSNNLYIVGSLIINENYPNYKAMFELTESLRTPRLDFYDTIHTVMDVLDPEDNSRLTINFTDNVLTLRNDKVESVQTFDESFTANLDIDVNGEVLDSILRDFIGDDIEIHFTEGNNYIVFKSPENEKHTALLTVLKRR